MTRPCACRVTSALCHQVLVIPAGRTALQLFLISFMFSVQWFLFPCKDFCNAAQAVSQALRSIGAAPLEAVDYQLQNLGSKAIWRLEASLSLLLLPSFVVFL